MNRLFNFLLGMITILSFTNVMGQDDPRINTLPPQEVLNRMTDRDYYQESTRQYIFSWTKGINETAADAYNYIRAKRLMITRPDGSRFFRWYFDFNPNYNARAKKATTSHRDYYGFALPNSVGTPTNIVVSRYRGGQLVATDRPNSFQSLPNSVFNIREYKTGGNKGSEFYLRVAGRGNRGFDLGTGLNGNDADRDGAGSCNASGLAYWTSSETTRGFYGKDENPSARHQNYNAYGALINIVDYAQFSLTISGGLGNQEDRYTVYFETDINNTPVSLMSNHPYYVYHNQQGETGHLIAVLPKRVESTASSCITNIPTPIIQSVTSCNNNTASPESGIANLNAFPAGTTVEWLGNVQNGKRSAIIKVPGTAQEGIVVEIPIVQSSGESCSYPATGLKVRLLVGEDIDDNAKDFVRIGNNYPSNKLNNTSFSWIVKPNTSTDGDKTGQVKVVYTDRSEAIIDVVADVVFVPAQNIVEVPRGSSEAQVRDLVQRGTQNTWSYSGTTPIVKSVPSARIPSTQVPKLYENNEAAVVTIANRDNQATNRGILSGTSSISGTIYTRDPNVQDGVIITTDVKVPVRIIASSITEDSIDYPATGYTLRMLKGENLVGKAHEFVSFPANIPADRRPDNSAIVWKTTPNTQNGGEQNGVVEITYKDGTTSTINVKADVVFAPDQDIVQIIRGTSEAQAKEKVKAETDRGNSWQSTEPVVKSVPSTATIATYTGNNGALVTIANTETANGKKVLSASSITGTSYRITNGNVVITTDVRVPVEIVGNQADTNNPTAKTVRILKGENIDDKAGDFVNLPNAPQGTRYEWVTKPNTSADFTGGQTNIGNNVVKVIYPDGSEENVNGITANVVNTPAQNTKAYILQHSLEADAKNKIQNVTNRPAAWASGKAAEVVGSISTATIGDANATVSIENIFSNNNIITGASSITGTSYSKTDKNLVSIVTNVSVPYTIVNKPVKTDNNAIEVSTGSTISNDNLLAKIGNKDGWQVVSVTPPDTNSTGGKTATVVLRHPNLPESDNQTFTIPVNVVARNADTYSPTAKTVRILKGENIDDKAGDFVNLPNAPQGTRYEWVTKPDTSADFTGGQTNIGNNVVKVIYPDGSEENVNGITANVVNTPAQTQAYILQGTPETDAKNKIQAATVRGGGWNNGKAPEVVGSIDTAIVRDDVATVSMGNNISTTNAIISTNSSLNGTSYEKTGNLVSIVTNVSVPYTIVNKPEVINNTPLQVELGSTISNDNLLAKIGNKDGWEVVSITPPDTDATGDKTATVVLHHPNLPESDNQTFTIPVNVVDTTPQVLGTIDNLLIFKEGSDFDRNIPATDNSGTITSVKVIRVINDREFALNGIATPVENNVPKFRITGANVNYNGGDTYTRRILVEDAAGNKSRAHFTVDILDVQSTAINREFGSTVSADDILNATNLVKGNISIPNENQTITKEIVSVNGQPYDGNNLPTSGDNTVRVRYTNTVTGQTKEVDVPVTITDSQAPTFNVRNLYPFLNERVDYTVPVRDNVGVSEVKLYEPSSTVNERGITGFAIVKEGNDFKLQGVNHSGVTAGGDYSRRFYARDNDNNEAFSDPFQMVFISAQGGTINKPFRGSVTRDEILNRATVLAGNKTIPANEVTKELVNADGTPFTGNLPTSGRNVVKVKLTNSLGQSKIVDVAVNFGEPPYCVKPANTTGEGLSTKVGITDLGRAGETPESWPMLRKGGWIALESNDKGFVITRMNTAQINALTAQEGMMVYDKDAQCLKIYDGTKWSCFSKPACPVE